MAREKRSDSASAKVEDLREAAKDIEPPTFVRLRNSDLPYWYSITRARRAWNDHDLIQAAALARCYSDIERFQRRLEREGSVIRNQKGTPIANPLHSVLETLTRRSIALSRIIQVHAQATQGDSKEQKKKAAGKQAARGRLEQLDDDDDDLLARPH